MEGLGAAKVAFVATGCATGDIVTTDMRSLATIIVRAYAHKDDRTKL